MTETTSLFFFGDSICFGQGVSLHLGWIPNLSREIELFAASNGHDVVVVNSAVNGRTTRIALENMPFEVQSHRPTFCLVQFGLNDSNTWRSDLGLPRVSPKAFQANLEEIACRCLQFGTKRVFFNTNHPTKRRSHGEGKASDDSRSREYNLLIREAAHNTGSEVELIDVEEHFDSLTTCDRGIEHFLLEDGIHLNVEGHRVYYDLILPRLCLAFKEMWSRGDSL